MTERARISKLRFTTIQRYYGDFQHSTNACNGIRMAIACLVVAGIVFWQIRRHWSTYDHCVTCRCYWCFLLYIDADKTAVRIIRTRACLVTTSYEKKNEPKVTSLATAHVSDVRVDTGRKRTSIPSRLGRPRWSLRHEKATVYQRRRIEDSVWGMCV